MGLWSRLTKTFRRRRHAAEIDEEIAFHLAMKEESGYGTREARLRFGNPARIREEVREAGILEWLASLLHDARYGVRQMARTPGLTLTILLSLAIGIGGNSAIFGIVDAALLKPLPVRNPDSLVLLEWTAPAWPDPLMDWHSGSFNRRPDGNIAATSVSAQLHRRMAREQTALETLVGFSDPTIAAVVIKGRPAEQAQMQYVSENFFQALGVTPPVGRPFTAEDDRVGQEPVVIISHGFWQRQFGGSADALNHSLRVNNVVARIVGVARPGFFGVQVGEATEIYALLAAKVTLDPGLRLAGAKGEDEKTWWVRQMGHLKPDTTPAAAAVHFSFLFRRFGVPDGVKLADAMIPSFTAQPARRGLIPCWLCAMNEVIVY